MSNGGAMLCLVEISITGECGMFFLVEVPYFVCLKGRVMSVGGALFCWCRCCVASWGGSVLCLGRFHVMSVGGRVSLLLGRCFIL